MKKSTFIVGVSVALFVGVTAGYFLSNHLVSLGASSPVGTTNSTAKVLSTVFSLATASGTSTSVLNNTGHDVAIQSSWAMCQGVGTSKTAYTGAGLLGLVFRGATTSTAFTGNITDANSNYGTNMNVATTTTDDYAATSTEGIIAGTSRIIPNGSYYTFSSNATNTATCTVGVSIIAL